MNKLVLLATTAVLGSIAMGSAASAQAIEEIIVTAQRSEQNIQKVSQSITAIGGDKLQALGVRNATDLASYVPGVVIKQGGATPAVFIRGVGTSNSSVTGDQGVAMHIDGVFQARASAFTAGFFDIDRVEVLKGPQGTLYGRGSIGGSINVITNAPKMEYQGSASADFGNYNLMRATGMLNIPVNEATRTAVRVAFTTESRDGYADNGGDDAHNSGLRFRMSSKPFEPLSLDLNTFVYRSKANGVSNYPLRTYSATRTADLANYHSYLDVSSNFNNLEIRQASLNIDYDLGFAVITALPSYTVINNKFRNTNLATLNGVAGSDNTALSDLNSNTATQELRIASPGGSRIKWVGGVYNLHEKNRYSVANGAIVGWLTTNSTGVFAQGTYPILDTLRVIGGVRRTKESKDQYTGTGLHFENSWSVTNFRVSGEYDLAPASMLYLTYATGFKAGGFFTSVAPNYFDPETVKVTELGSKNRFLEGTLQLNAAIFYSKYDKYQVNRTIVAAFPGATTQGVFNGGAAEVKGAEAEVIWQFTEKDRIEVSGNYSDGKFTTITVTPTTAKVGDRLPSTAKYSSNIAYTHDFTVPTGILSARAETHLESSSYISLSHNVNTRQGSYSKSNVTLTYTPEEGAYNVSAWVRNIEDKAIRGNIGETVNNETVNLAPPRTYGVSVSAKF